MSGYNNTPIKTYTYIGTPPTIDSLQSVQTNNDSLLISWTISVPYEAYTLQLNISNDDGYSLYDVYGLTMYELHQPSPCYISLTLQLNVSCTVLESITVIYITGICITEVNY